jgi:cytochrome P450
MEARLLLATIVQRFTPRVTPGRPVVARPRVTLRMAHGMRVRLDRADAPVLSASVAARLP